MVTTTRIDTSYAVWKSISRGELDGNASAQSKLPSMVTMLLPWITFWVAVSIHAEAGAMITLAVCAMVPLIMRKYAMVIWDRLSMWGILYVCTAVWTYVLRRAGFGGSLLVINNLVFFSLARHA